MRKVTTMITTGRRTQLAPHRVLQERRWGISNSNPLLLSLTSYWIQRKEKHVDALCGGQHLGERSKVSLEEKKTLSSTNITLGKYELWLQDSLYKPHILEKQTTVYVCTLASICTYRYKRINGKILSLISNRNWHGHRRKLRLSHIKLLFTR